MVSTANYSPVKLKKKPIRLGDAWRAIKALLADKEDTSQVFRIIDALSGGAEQKNYFRFVASPTGAAIIREKRSLLETLSNREYLRSLPEDSLGRHYLHFMESEQLTADGLVDASKEGPDYSALPEDAQLFACRQRDMHDLWHVTTGYGRDGLGELSLLAFTYAQGRNRGIGAIVLFGTKSVTRDHPGLGIWKAVREGYRLGKQAEWMPIADWERLLTQPLNEVRRTLKLTPPVIYQNLSRQLANAEPMAKAA